MNYTIKEYGTFVGRYTIDEAPNEFLRELMVRATGDGVVVEQDHEGCLVTVYCNDDEIG